MGLPVRTAFKTARGQGGSGRQSVLVPWSWVNGLIDLPPSVRDRTGKSPYKFVTFYIQAYICDRTNQGIKFGHEQKI